MKGELLVASQAGKLSPPVSPGLERDEDGELSGKDPRSLDVVELNNIGHAKSSMAKVIRAKCTDCVCGQIAEIRKCTCAGCPLWPYRMGKNPFSTRTGNPNLKRPGEPTSDFDVGAEDDHEDDGFPE